MTGKREALVDGLPGIGADEFQRRHPTRLPCSSLR